jgi:glyine---[glycyl-carrier protein] ligase
MRQCSLPDGTQIRAPNALEVAILYREIVAERTYERHGITVTAGDVVFDVGANIGLFAIHLSRTVPGARVHSFEPLPPLFDALTRNLATHAPAARAYNVGFADVARDAVFEFDPHMTIATTMYPAALRDAADLRAPASAWAVAGFADLHRVQPNAVTGWIASRSGRPAALAAAVVLGTPIAVLREIRRRLFLQRHTCRLQTLSSAARDAGVERIDLVKIDVEGAEEAVLAGIDAQTWPCIRQLVIEVHDVDGRVVRLRRLLEGHGFTTTTAREDWELHALLGISTVYAARP